MATNHPPSPTSHGRKRKLNEQESGRSIKTSNTNGDNNQVPDHIYASLLQGINDAPTSNQDESSRTAQAALQQQQSSYPEPNVFDHAGVSGGFEDPTAGLAQGAPHHQMNPAGQGIFDARQSQQNKPVVGSQAWHQLRKDNHKEVERRRREVINEGIENIAKMIPGQDKNKGAVLQNACRYIQELQAKIASFDNERNVFEITQQELTRRNQSLRDNAERSWSEMTKWMNRCRDANLPFDDYDQSVEPALEEDTTDLPTTGAAGDANDFNVGGGVQKVDNPMA